MMHRLRTITLLGAVACSSFFASTVASAATIVALTTQNQLLTFDSSTPGTTSTPVSITGLMAGDALQGIDARPNTGTLYGFSKNGTTGRVYSINASTGVATLSSTLDTAVTGNFFGVDFNPVADRLRVVSDARQNLRINVDSGVTITDGTLTYAVGDVNATSTPEVVAAAYTNSIGTPASTTLYDIDQSNFSLVLQNPPNSGTLNTIGSLNTGIFSPVAFEIDGTNNIAYAVLNGFELSTIDLTSGAASFVGNIGLTSGSVFSIATNVSSVPEPTTLLTVGLAAAGFGWYHRRRKVSKASAAT